MQTVIQSVLPVFLVIALGVGLTKTGMISIEVRRGLNRLLRHGGGGSSIVAVERGGSEKLLDPLELRFELPL